MKNRFRKAISFLLAAVFALSIFTQTVFADNAGIKVSLGADLNPGQRQTVLQFLDLTEEDIQNMNVTYVTNQEEHEYLDPYIEYDKIGTTALSSSKIVFREEGYGIHVETYNINYCTVGMYQSALATAGVKNADVYVAAPDKISGTAALIGIMKAYNDASDTQLDPSQVEAATQELAVTSEIGSIIDDPQKAEELVALLKQELNEINNMDDASVDDLIRQTAESLGITLSDENVVSIRQLLRTLGSLDIDWDSILGQLSSLYEKFTSGDTGNNVVMDFLYNIGGFFTDIFSKIGELFSNIFG